ncbi:MAG: manganese efflux pump [Spirochaetaceae bacterium]|nr:manganese efflux pump [Spirochaetaceae bacterium]
MGLGELVLLAMGLAMDAFAVSVTNGMCLKKCGLREVLAMALTFGTFQAAMPVLGYLGGSLFYEQIKFVDHWIAFGLLAFLGIRMILEGIKSWKELEKGSCDVRGNSLTLKLLLVQGIATSIDALAVGISLSVVQANILFAALTIGLITFLLCAIASVVGRRFGTMLNDKAEILGGLILIGIGTRILISHLIA